MSLQGMFLIAAFPEIKSQRARLMLSRLPFLILLTSLMVPDMVMVLSRNICVKSFIGIEKTYSGGA